MDVLLVLGFFGYTARTVTISRYTPLTKVVYKLLLQRLQRFASFSSDFSLFIEHSFNWCCFCFPTFNYPTVYLSRHHRSSYIQHSLVRHFLRYGLLDKWTSSTIRRSIVDNII